VELAGLEQFDIRFVHLKPGQYRYQFDITDTFFQAFDYSLIEQASLQVNTRMIKENESLLHFTFFIEGSLNLGCDRCLDAFDMPVHLEEQLIVKVTEDDSSGSEGEDEDGNLIYIPPEDIAFNVAKPIFDFINLAKPMKPTCSDVNKDCNPEMMNILSSMQKGPKSKDNGADIDPRWEALKQFKNQQNNN
jgi:uncharacterized metal-binding protein YceD (DUF177 family)